MIENAKRQLILILAVAGIALFFVTTKELKRGPDLRGGTELIYEVDPEQMTRENEGIAPSDTQVDRTMQETVAIVSERIDPTGTLEAVVVRRGKLGMLIELPAMDKTELDGVAQRVSELGRLEMRIVAGDIVDDTEMQIDVAPEKTRLETWIKEGDNRAMLAKDPSKIEQYNATLENKDLKWYPQRFLPSLDNSEIWNPRAGAVMGDPKMVTVYEAADFNGGLVKEDLAPEQRYLVAYVPINMKAMSFSGEDLDAAGVRATTDQRGRPALGYRLKGSRTTDYADWSEKYIGEQSAIILNGYVYSAPVFRSRIPGVGVIEGDFTQRQINNLIKILKTGSLKVVPIETSRRTIGANLGARAVELGQLSVIIGGLLVLAFILFYYRLAGMVAFIAIALNILLIFGVLTFIEATLTLPGIAGLVLTIGMAVDANILIYERIREELRAGKELLQGMRVGFERAMVTILDANITTFLAGIVLYNVGVGPIRGFAVTLMIGIVTSVFTAFFVSRLVFHYMLERDMLKEFNAKALFSNLKVDFLRYSKVAFIISAAVIVLGLIGFGSTPDGTKLGLDFTGGAKLTVVLDEPVTADELRSRLTGSQFAKDYPSWVVNTVGSGIGADDKTNSYNVKVKLTADQRATFEEARQAAARAEEEYQAPYITSLASTLSDSLVHKAFENATVNPDPDQPARQFARIDLNFAKPVTVTELAAAVRDAYGEDPKEPNVIKALDAGEGGTSASRYTVEYNVASRITAEQLGPDLAEKLRASLASSDGSEIVLSDPIPESEEIGGRMVGELQNAAISALIVSLFLIVMFIRIRFHEYKYGFGAVAALVHDVLVTLGIVVAANAMGLVNAELDLAMIAAFLTIIGYSINDTIVIFDRVRENLNVQARLGERADHAELMNRSINQTLSRTILTTVTTLFVVLVQFFVNRGSGSSLEGFSFALIVGLLSGTYSTIFIATPVVLWMRRREGDTSATSGDQAAA